MFKLARRHDANPIANLSVDAWFFLSGEPDGWLYYHVAYYIICEKWKSDAVKEN